MHSTARSVASLAVLRSPRLLKEPRSFKRQEIVEKVRPIKMPAAARQPSPILPPVVPQHVPSPFQHQQ